MRYFHTRLSGLLVLFLSILLLVGCATQVEDEASYTKDIDTPQDDSQVKKELQVPQGQNDELNNDCDAVKDELKLMQANYDELSAEHKDLNTKYDELSAKHEVLNTKYDELSVEYDTVMQEMSGINEEDVEQVIFEIVNQDRQNNGLNELEWSDGLYGYAKRHSDHMVTFKRLEYYEANYCQDIFRSTGYSTLDRMANATLIIWKESSNYKSNFLNEHVKYGAVAVSKSGDIFYITYFAHIY